MYLVKTLCELLSTEIEVKRSRLVRGVPLSAEAKSRFCEGKKNTNWECLTLSERAYLEYVCYMVRPYERAPLRCFCSRAYEHVAAVCRVVRCCGKDNCNVKECKVDEEQAQCLK